MINRLYEAIILDHFHHNNQMLFLVGPRQVGKTTIAKKISKKWDNYTYMNWDDMDDRALILSGQQRLAEAKKISTLKSHKFLIIFDEIHKYPEWKNYLKGFYDKYKDLTDIIVTGSAQLDTMQKGGDSLMGRYFNLRIHPLSVAECIDTNFTESLIRPPKPLSTEKFALLQQYGGFPDPFLKAKDRFHKQWSQTREQQLLREDVRDLSHVQELSRLSMLTSLLRDHCGKLVNYTSFAGVIGVSSETIKR
ncbi:MAG: ATP-binding protein, partial [Gammaproteobacteria bacterium]